jgi:hypothetical protein
MDYRSNNNEKSNSVKKRPPTRRDVFPPDHGIDKKFKRDYNKRRKRGTTGRRLTLNMDYRVTAGFEARRLLLFIATFYKSNDVYDKKTKSDQIAKAYCHNIAPFLRSIRGLQKLPSCACAEKRANRLPYTGSADAILT